MTMINLSWPIQNEVVSIELCVSDPGVESSKPVKAESDTEGEARVPGGGDQADQAGGIFW